MYYSDFAIFKQAKNIQNAERRKFETGFLRLSTKFEGENLGDGVEGGSIN